MRRFLITAAVALATPGGTALAEGLAEHTFLLAWASENCEGFEYAPDLLRHAVMDVQSAPEAEVKAMTSTVIGGLKVLHDGDLAEMCETAIFLIENPEED